jgi:hypothetical protein
MENIKNKILKKENLIIAGAVATSLTLTIIGIRFFVKKLRYAKLEADNLLKIQELHPNLRKDVTKFLIDAKKEGYNLRIYFAYRTPEQQDALYAQGRLPLAKVNEMRKKVGLYQLQPHENTEVTDAKRWQSYHNYGLAIDVVDRINAWTIDWYKLYKIADKYGLKPLAKEKNHFQKTYGFLPSQLKQMLDKGTINKLKL